MDVYHLPPARDREQVVQLCLLAAIRIVPQEEGSELRRSSEEWAALFEELHGSVDLSPTCPESVLACSPLSHGRRRLLCKLHNQVHVLVSVSRH